MTEDIPATFTTQFSFIVCKAAVQFLSSGSGYSSLKHAMAAWGIFTLWWGYMGSGSIRGRK